MVTVTAIDDMMYTNNTFTTSLCGNLRPLRTCSRQRRVWVWVIELHVSGNDYNVFLPWQTVSGNHLLLLIIFGCTCALSKLSLALVFRSRNHILNDPCIPISTFKILEGWREYLKYCGNEYVLRNDKTFTVLIAFAPINIIFSTEHTHFYREFTILKGL